MVLELNGIKLECVFFLCVCSFGFFFGGGGGWVGFFFH